MKIAIEAQRIFRKKKHGMDIVALQLIRHLQKIDDVNEYFILVEPDEDNKVLIETKNFHIIEISATPYPIWEQFYLRRMIKKIKPDILHCTSNTAPLNIKVPLVLTLHDILYMQKIDFTKGTWYQRLGNLYRKWIVPKVIPQSDQIITVSDFEKQQIIKRFSLHPGRVRVIHNAYSDYFKPVLNKDVLEEAKKKYGLPDQFILYLGNTHPNKNIRSVLRALSKLQEDKETKIPLVMPDIDKAFLKKILIEINNRELVNSIYLTGYVPNHELPNIYSLAKIFIYPSFHESFGIPMLEAMACGIPVIASNKAALPEVANSAALMVDPENPDEIVRAVKELLTDKELYRQLKEDGLKRTLDFSWYNTARNILGIYKELYHQLPKKH